MSGIYDRIYKEEHRQLSRLSMYASVFSRVPVSIMLALILVWLVTFLVRGPVVLGSVGAAIGSLWLGLKLWAKHSQDCPNCTGLFFGKFRLFMPYSDRCQNCNFCIIPDDPIKLDLKDM